jgi:hypothetical protein
VLFSTMSYVSVLGTSNDLSHGFKLERLAEPPFAHGLLTAVPTVREFLGWPFNASEHAFAITAQGSNSGSKSAPARSAADMRVGKALRHHDHQITCWLRLGQN